ncbi:MAG: hypothetical protein DMG01_21080 [Acidobacteria bacterium]|nr:MAG: hypothetical protein DMG01_21080 [Acidobacteriota bacterium]
MVRLSVLDLATITQGSDAATAFRQSLDYARHAERLGIHRYWLAEHHNMPGIASAATAIVIAHVASETTSIRVPVMTGRRLSMLETAAAAKKFTLKEAQAPVPSAGGHHALFVEDRVRNGASQTAPAGAVGASQTRRFERR